MKVSLNFEFDSNEAAEAFLRQVRERAAQVAQPAPEPEQSKAKRGRKPKAQTEPVVQEVQMPAEVSPTPTLASKEDAQAALEKVFAAKGLATARNLLSRFGVQRLQDMAPVHYAVFCDQAEKVLAGGEV